MVENYGSVVTSSPRTINADANVENVELTIASGNKVNGDVKHEGAGICTINETIAGGIQAC